MTSDSSFIPPFNAACAPDDGIIATRLLESAGLGREQDSDR
jgi:hypothetical protein